MANKALWRSGVDDRLDLISDTAIDGHQAWQRTFVRNLEGAYG